MLCRGREKAFIAASIFNKIFINLENCKRLNKQSGTSHKLACSPFVYLNAAVSVCLECVLLIFNCENFEFNPSLGGMRVLWTFKHFSPGFYFSGVFKCFFSYVLTPRLAISSFRGDLKTESAGNFCFSENTRGHDDSLEGEGTPSVLIRFMINKRWKWNEFLMEVLMQFSPIVSRAMAEATNVLITPVVIHLISLG